MFEPAPSIRVKPDRRKTQRRSLPACLECSHASVEVIARAHGVLYVQCPRCHGRRGVRAPLDPLLTV